MIPKTNVVPQVRQQVYQDRGGTLSRWTDPRNEKGERDGVIWHGGDEGRGAMNLLGPSGPWPKYKMPTARAPRTRGPAPLCTPPFHRPIASSIYCHSFIVYRRAGPVVSHPVDRQSRVVCFKKVLPDNKTNFTQIIIPCSLVDRKPQAEV